MEVTKRNSCMAKRIVSIILTAVILMSASFETALAGVNATADMVNDGLDGAASDNTAGRSDNIAGLAFNHGNCEIIYTVKSEWENHQTVEITLTNTGDTAIRNWALSIKTPGCIT